LKLQQIQRLQQQPPPLQNQAFPLLSSQQLLLQLPMQSPLNNPPGFGPGTLSAAALLQPPLSSLVSPSTAASCASTQLALMSQAAQQLFSLKQGILTTLAALAANARQGTDLKAAPQPPLAFQPRTPDSPGALPGPACQAHAAGSWTAAPSCISPSAALLQGCLGPAPALGLAPGPLPASPAPQPSPADLLHLAALARRLEGPARAASQAGPPPAFAASQGPDPNPATRLSGRVEAFRETTRAAAAAAAAAAAMAPPAPPLHPSSPGQHCTDPSAPGTQP
jgi:hypothetical protein